MNFQSILKFFVVGALAISISGCGDDVTNVAAPAPANNPTEVKVSSAATYVVQLKDEVQLPVLSSGFKLIKGDNVCLIRTSPLLEKITVTAGTVLSFTGATASLEGQSDETLNVIMLVGAPLNVTANCDLSSSEVEVKGFSVVLGEIFSETEKVTVEARRVATEPTPEPTKLIKSKIKITDSDTTLKKLTRSLTFQNIKIGECTISFKNLGDVDPVLTAQLKVVSDKVDFIRGYDPRAEYPGRVSKPEVYIYDYVAKLGDGAAASVNCSLVLDKADQVSSAIDTLFNSSETKLRDVTYF